MILTCRRCEFVFEYERPARQGNLPLRCADCRILHVRERLKRNREKPESREAQKQSRVARRSERKAWIDANRQRLSNYQAKRRAAKKGADTELVDALKVAERDGWVCYLCDNPVDPLVQRPDLMCRSIDHVIPLSKGGPHNYSNVRLAHLICNLRKLDSMPEEQIG